MFVKRTVFCASLALLVATMPAHAATTKEIPSLVITPLKFEQDLNSVPYAVSIIDQDDLQETQATSFDDALRNIPTFDSGAGPRKISEEPSLRGLSDRRLVIKVDGIRRNFRAQYAGRYFVDPFMVDRIEVVRGANSAIDGSGAIGGTIQIFTADAERELRGSTRNYGTTIKAGGASADDEYSGMLSAYAVQDWANVYGAFSNRDADNYRSGNDTTIQSSSSRPQDALVKGGVEFAPNHTLQLRLARYYDESNVPVSPGQPVAALSNDASERDTKVTDKSLHYRAAPGGDLKGLVDINAVVYNTDIQVNTKRLRDNRLDTTFFNTFGTDVYNNASYTAFGARNTLTTGVEYFEDKQEGKRNGALRPGLGDGSDSTVGVYTQHSTRLWQDRLTITPGIRFDKYELTPTSGPDQTKTHWSPKVGANLKVTDNWSTYASYAEAFRTPTLTELYASGALGGGFTAAANPNLKPETSDGYEAGVRFDKDSLILADDRAKLQVGYFVNNIDSYIEQTISGSNVQFNNVARAELHGFEVEGSYAAGDYRLLANFGTVRGENVTANTFLGDVPPDRYSGALEKFWLDNSVKTGVRQTYYSSQDQVPTNNSGVTPTDEAFITDIYATYVPSTPKYGDWRLDVGVDNLFDANYRRYLAFLPEYGRNAKATVTWKY